MEMMAVAVVAAVDAVLPVDDQDEAEADDDPYDLPHHFGLRPDPPNKPPHEVPGALLSPSHLEPSEFTSVTHVDARSRTIGARTGNCQCHHDQ